MIGIFFAPAEIILCKQLLLLMQNHKDCGISDWNIYDYIHDITSVNHCKMISDAVCVVITVVKYVVFIKTDF